MISNTNSDSPCSCSLSDTESEEGVFCDIRLISK
jgi:hypothetical protein